MKTFCKVLLFSAAILCSLSDIAHAQILSEAKLDLSLEMPAEYNNQASQGLYMNPTWVGEVPQWNYYDIFGNHLLEGFYLYGMTMAGDGEANKSTMNMHQILKKWYNGMVQVGDLDEKRGLLVMVGDRVNTKFTPYTFNQSLFCGARVDAFVNFYGLNSVSIINSRISNSGIFGTGAAVETNADWLHGIHVVKKVDDIIDIGATYINLHNQVATKANNFNGALADSFPVNTPTALSIFGFDGRCNLPEPGLTMYGEYARCQEVLGGNFKPRPGNLATLNTRWDVFDRLRLGGEGYIVESRYKTTFDCPVHYKGDLFGSGKYLYSLVDDNDDGDEFPENGKAKINAVPEGDPDGTISVKHDKDKNGKFDYEEDFLSYDADPPKSGLYYDRNNNEVVDETEDDAYPDYPYKPGYYLPGERYMRYDDIAGKWTTDTSDGQISKGVLGYHLNGQFQIFSRLSLTLGWLSERSEKNSFQTTYLDTAAVGLVSTPEKATTLYSLIRYQNDFPGEKTLTVDNYFRIIKDNIPNHSQNSVFVMTDSSTGEIVLQYTTVVDELDYRDAIVEMLIAEYTIFKNRGFNFTTRGKFEFQKHNPHVEFNYTGKNVYSLMLVNKCEYIYLLPFSKDMFIIPKYKNFIETMDYGPRSPSLDEKYKRSAMINAAYLVYEWKFTPKTAITTGLQYSVFSDFLNNDEDYGHGNWTVQLMVKDRYAGMKMILTLGFSKYKYVFPNSSAAPRNRFNNPHRIGGNISSYDLFLKIHCGF